MLTVRIMLLIAALALTACASTPAPHVSRNEAVKLLRTEGILHGSTRVTSAVWNEDLREWLITLRHASGNQSNWFVDATAKNYHGGTCAQ
jgi:hypothetical protein